MTPMLNVPCRVTDEAEAYVVELGLQEQFAEMLEHTRQTVPGLKAIEVNLEPSYDLGWGPCVLIEATMDDPHLDDDPTIREWAHWKSSHFSPEVSQHFTFLANYGFGLPHAR